MSKFSILILSILFSGTLLSQQKEAPVTWSFALDLKEDPGKLVMTADIQEGWYIYASTTPEGGPIGTSFTFDTAQFDNENVIAQGDLIKEQSALFELEVHKFKDRVQFMKDIPRTEADKLVGTVRYMCCNSVKCLPPTDVPFEILLQN